MSTWSTPSAWTAVTIGLNSLADTTSVTSSTTLTNGTGKDIFLDLSLILGSLTPGTSGPCVELHLLPLLADGTSYQDIVRAADVAPLLPGASIKNLASVALVIAPGTYKFAVVNRSGAAFAASGNALSFRTYSPA